ncbi:hypothetical protein RJ639_032235 [Escallonia herrerae]|uniref:tRNA(Ile)-lysidine synthetase n=1 Tax=Escallonia herrerae TaxID=1293975 RepID=A0AA89BF43_9ASTE|nr:hypothetical protein RJ639_032235 [Escallonia herrerae]
MARGIVISPHSKTTSHLILTSISRASSSLTKFTTNPLTASPNNLLRLSLSNPSNRVLCCNCSTAQHCNDPIDMSRYREAFSKRMAMAGLKPHHRIALGVSGGPDSMALCVLTADWKTGGFSAATKESSDFVEGLLAIVVDHGLRAESKDEANTVCHRVLNMGIRCEIAGCDWSDGRPKLGQLQEAARNMRYQNFQSFCMQHQIGVLFVAHHADDQAELFILRLSRNSGVLGLAGMAFTSQLFPTCANFNGKSSNGIVLMRPLLEFSKEDMYKICQYANQEWVEDPTNQSPLFVRNRIRMSLKNLASCKFKSELQSVISSCRKTRSYVDKVCCKLISQAVSIMPQGYAVIDLEILDPSNIKDVCLSKFVALILQFTSQRHRPVRGSALKLLLDYIRTFPCKTSLTAAGCYLCAAPGSKGTKVLVCCCVDSSFPSRMELLHTDTYEGHNRYISSEVEQIIADGKSLSDQMVSDASDLQILDEISSESVLIQAKRLKIISESTHRSIASLQGGETIRFRSKNEVSDCKLRNEVEPVTSSLSRTLLPGQIGYFMNRFLIRWKLNKKIPDGAYMDEGDFGRDFGAESQPYCCRSCLVDHGIAVEVRHMIDADWLYLAKLSECGKVENSQQQRIDFATKLEQGTETIDVCGNYTRKSAQRALRTLKSIPVAARRGLPVLVSRQGLLLSIPSVCFNHCPCLNVSADFKPIVPLGGGHTSFI